MQARNINGMKLREHLKGHMQTLLDKWYEEVMGNYHKHRTQIKGNKL